MGSATAVKYRDGPTPGSGRSFLAGPDRARVVTASKRVKYYRRVPLPFGEGRVVRWPRFRLRTLLTAVALAALVCGGLALWRRRAGFLDRARDQEVELRRWTVF